MLDTEIKYLLNDIALNSSRASFKRLYLFYYGKLFSLAKSLVKQDELAEEITNYVFMNLWTRRASLPEIITLLITATHRLKTNRLPASPKISQKV